MLSDNNSNHHHHHLWKSLLTGATLKLQQKDLN